MNTLLLSSAALVIISLALLVLACVFHMLHRKQVDSPLIVDLVFFFIYVKLSLYYALPTLLRIGSGYRFEVEEGVDALDLVKVYGVELVSWFFWYWIVYLVFKLFKGRQSISSTSVTHHGDVSVALTNVLLWLSILWFTTNIPSVDELLKPLTSNFVFDIFRGLPLYVGYTLGPLLLFAPRGRVPLLQNLLGGVLTIMSVVITGSRGSLVYLLIYCCFILLVVYRRRKLFLGIASLAIFIGVVYFAMGGLLVGRVGMDSDGNISVRLEVDTEKKGERSALEEVEWRFGALTRTSTAFFSMYDRGDGAGLNPIINSAMGFLPRSINPDKPYPSTVDGSDVYSQGMYLIWRELHGYDTYSMVEFSTGSHFYWELGWFGVVIMSLISGLYVSLCLVNFSKLGLISIPLLVAVFKPWGYVDPKIWVSDIVMQLYQIILPLVLLLFIINGYQRHSKLRKGQKELGVQVEEGIR